MQPPRNIFASHLSSNVSAFHIRGLVREVVFWRHRNFNGGDVVEAAPDVGHGSGDGQPGFLGLGDDLSALLGSAVLRR